MDDVAHHGQRPKADIFDDGVLVILNHPRWEGDGLVLDQVSMLLGRDVLITVHAGPVC